MQRMVGDAAGLRQEIAHQHLDGNAVSLVQVVGSLEPRFPFPVQLLRAFSMFLFYCSRNRWISSRWLPPELSAIDTPLPSRRPGAGCVCTGTPEQYCFICLL